MQYDILAIYSTIMTPALLLVGMMMAYIFLIRYQRESIKRRDQEFELQREMARIQREKTQDSKINIVNTPFRNENSSEEDSQANGSIAYFEVRDELKSLFVDLFSGFPDYARIKGYNIDFSVDTSRFGKVGIRFTILDVGVTVSTDKVRADVDEYIQRVSASDDLSDMPITVDPIEHGRLQAVLQTRFAYLRAQVEIKTAQEQFYQQLIVELKDFGVRGIAYPSLSINNYHKGIENMGDSYNASHSQGIAQGRGAKVAISESAINIGSTHSERSYRINSLKELEQTIHDSEIAPEVKQDSIRHLQNVREELEESTEPNPDVITKWLGKANLALTTAGAAASLMDKVKEVMGQFGIGI
ncbi:hypothetical protein [Desulfovibrio sp. TomC]|uniref:hypothetical protein n=1 Tax=Desulfovibrio sp. TomC TaxID=1562888 RepID=UPI0012E2F4F5|nr:hypothetical protein [Desulfovibrio sp. TomC]